SRLDSSTRAYALTGETRFLTQNNTNHAAVQNDLVTLTALTADNRAQQERLKLLSPLVAAKFAESNSILTARENGGIAAATPLIEAPAQATTTALVRLVDEMREEENRLLAERSQAALHTENNLKVMQMIGGALAMTLIGVAFWSA